MLIFILISLTISIFHWRSMLIHEWIWSIYKSNDRTIHKWIWDVTRFLETCAGASWKTFWHLVHALLPFNLPTINKTKTWGLWSSLPNRQGLFSECGIFMLSLLHLSNEWECLSRCWSGGCPCALHNNPFTLSVTYIQRISIIIIPYVFEVAYISKNNVY